MLNTISRAFLFCERKMISQKEFAFLVMKIFMWILTGAFWHGLYLWSSTGLLASSIMLMILQLMFIYVPRIRPEIRSAFAAYSWIYLVYFGIVSFLNGFSYFIQGLHDLNGIKEIIILPPFSPFHLHIYVFFEKVIQYVYWKIQKYYMTSYAETQREIFDDGVCAICMGPHDNPSRPHYGHTFCFECLWSWCRIKMACPLCSRPVTAIKSERQPQYVDDDSHQLDIISLIHFNVDEFGLNEEFVVINVNTVVFGMKWLAVWCLSFLWIYAMAWNYKYAAAMQSNAPQFIYGKYKEI